jgi:HEAT repeat protein
MKQFHWMLAVLASGLALPLPAAAQTPDIRGNPPRPLALPALVQESKQIVVLEVVEVSPDEGTIVFQRLADLKARGRPAQAQAKLTAMPVPGMTDLLHWAEPGRLALAFHVEHDRFICVGNCWFLNQDGLPAWQPATHWHSDWRTTYVGPVEKLVQHIRDLLAGREVVITARPNPEHGHTQLDPALGPPDWLRGKKGRVCRLKVSPNLKRPPEIVGWGVGGPEVVPDLIKRLKSSSPLMRAEAAEDLGQLGPVARDAVPSLRDRLQDPDPFVRLFAAEALARVRPDAPIEIDTFRQGLKHAEAPVRLAAIAALAALEVRAQATVPDLLGLLRADSHDELRSLAATALGEIGPEATLPGSRPSDIVPGMVKALGNAITEGQAFHALLKFGPAAQPALLDLRDMLPINAFAGGVLCRMGPAGVAAVAEALGEYDEMAPNHLIWLGQVGPRARLAIPALMGALKDPDCARDAARALLNIDRKLAAPMAVPVLIELLKEHEEDNVKWHLLSELNRLCPGAAQTVPFYVQFLKQKDAHRRWFAADALGNFGPKARPALPALRAALADENVVVRLMAAKAIWRITGDKAVAVPAFRESLRNPQTCCWMHRDAIKLLDELGGLDSKVALELAGLLKAKQDNDARYGVLCSLAELGAKAKPARPALRRFIRREKDQGVRLHAVVALLSIRPTDRQALAALKAALESADDTVRWEAVLALGEERHHKPAREYVEQVLPLLERALADVNLDVRTKAAEALGQLGPEAKAAAGALVAALKDLNPQMKEAAVTSLYRIHPQHPAIVLALVQLLEEAPNRQPSPILAELGPRARPAVPQLVRLYRRLGLDEGMAVLDLLEKIDPEAAAKLWPKEEPGPVGVSPRQLETLWNDLACGNTPRGYRAYWKILMLPKPPVALFKQRLFPVPKVEPEQIARWIADLESNRFEIRQKAAEALENIEAIAEPALRRVLAGAPSLELRQRVEGLLDKLDPAKSGERQRLLWSVEILERIGTPEAQEVLKVLAGGAAEARLTKEAQAALKRLAHPRPRGPE